VPFDRSFKFHDTDLQQRLVAAMRRAGVAHSVNAGDGAVCFSSEDERAFDDAAVEVRDFVYGEGSWHVCQCEPDEVCKYIEYMRRHGIRYVQETDDREPWFLLDRQHDPEKWGIW